MLKLAFAIWIGLLGYRAYDYIYIENAPKPEVQQTTTPQKTEPVKPTFNANWEGYTAKKIKAKKMDSRLGKAVPVAQKARQANRA